MTGTQIRAAIVTEKISYIREMLEAVRRLPLSSYDDFGADFRNAAAAESCLRRALESLFDLGRHILAKGFAVAPAEYKEIAQALIKHKILSGERGQILRQMAGYRNRMVHFYHEITVVELYTLCSENLSDIEEICEAFVGWLRRHANKVDASI